MLFLNQIKFIQISLILWITPGWSIHHSWGGCSHLYHHGPLAGESSLLTHPIPSSLIQTRHQATYPGSGEAQGSLQVIVISIFHCLSFVCHLENLYKCISGGMSIIPFCTIMLPGYSPWLFITYSLVLHFLVLCAFIFCRCCHKRPWISAKKIRQG